VHDDRQPELARQTELTPEPVALRVARRKVVMVVEADFADRDDLALHGQRFEPGQIARASRQMRVHSDRRNDCSKAFGELELWTKLVARRISPGEDLEPKLLGDLIRQRLLRLRDTPWVGDGRRE